MKEVAPGYLPQESAQVLRDLEGLFLASEAGSLSRDTVAEIADLAITAAGDFSGQSVIVYFGDPETFQPVLGSDDDREAAVLDEAFSGIRNQVGEALRTAYPDKDFTVVGRFFHDHVIGFAGNRVIKAPLDLAQREYVEPSEIKQQRLDALRTLYTLPDRSTRVAYDIISIDPSIRPHEGVQIQRRLSMRTFHELLYANPPPTLSVSLRYFEQAVEGATFLVNNGMRLNDLTLRNIAIMTATDTALLFDFDGLRLQDAAVEGYRAEPDWIPPERRKARLYEPNIGQPITISEMVYEMGISLDRILRRYYYGGTLSIFQESMVHMDPSERPRLEEVAQTIAQTRLA